MNPNEPPTDQQLDRDRMIAQWETDAQGIRFRHRAFREPHPRGAAQYSGVPQIVVITEMAFAVRSPGFDEGAGDTDRAYKIQAEHNQKHIIQRLREKLKPQQPS